MAPMMQEIVSRMESELMADYGCSVSVLPLLGSFEPGRRWEGVQ
jgi:hypothetical protein